ncbi:MAG: Prefoldin subunit alpha [Candidatus Heimdallarchaeota archaeon LC_3]|nr:MAG: Prefoldin subunit alpha [Candidatus Heimdallarchaeota archaeon LC_3]
MGNSDIPNLTNQDQLKQDQLRKQIDQISRELNQLNSQIQYVNQQLSIITNYRQDISAALRSINEIKTKKIGEKVLIPLSSKLFLPVSLSEESRSELLINLGSSILKRGNLADASEKLEKELEQSKKVIEALQGDYSKLETEIMNRESFLSQFYK